MAETNPPPPGFAPSEADDTPDAPPPPSKPAPAPRRKGLQCPRCGCRHFRTPDTVPVTGAIRRYRYCRHCGLRVITREIIEH